MGYLDLYFEPMNCGDFLFSIGRPLLLALWAAVRCTRVVNRSSKFYSLCLSY